MQSQECDHCVKFCHFYFYKITVKLDHLIREFLCENKDKRDRKKIEEITDFRAKCTMEKLLYVLINFRMQFFN